MNDRLTQFNSICRENNLRVTPQRTAVYEALIKSKSHPTAEQIYNEVKKIHPSISFNTVNETLLTFTKIGLIELIEGFGNSRRFDPNLENHHHVHCIECGKILDFINSEFDKLKIPSSVNKEFNIHSTKIVLTGICNSCSKTIKRKG